ncbi:MAG: NAD(P)/FAD-dependent oxidoreductase, partial [Bacteroidia bacterium]
MDADAIIIGAGACGLMCAVQAGFLGKRVILIEKNSKPGAKILISGGGRCNFTNLWTTSDQFISANPHFAKSALTQWTVEDTIGFFETYGITGKEKTLGQLFPESQNAAAVVQLFMSLCEDMGQQIYCNATATTITRLIDGFEVNYTSGDSVRTLRAPKLVVTSGGLPI